MNDLSALSFSVPLTPRRKAAIVVQMLLADGGSLPLAELPEDLQELLTGELAQLDLLDRATMDAVADDFLRALDATGMAAPGSRDGAITALAAHLSPGLAAKLQAQTDAVRNGDHWPLITALPLPRLVRIMTLESVEIAAITLAKLPVAKAAEVLAQTPGPRARRITYAMSLTRDIAPETVRKIGQALARDHAQDPPVAFDKGPDLRLGAILTSASTDTREDMLQGLGDTDPDFASDVRRAIFTFKDIAPRVKPTDVAACLRGIDGGTMATALAAALAGDAALVASAEFILANMSQRMAAQLREDAADRGTVTKSAGEAAMGEVTRAVRELVEANMITLRDPDEDAA
jgi:flagellar motor switch protein FliG